MDKRSRTLPALVASLALVVAGCTSGASPTATAPPASAPATTGTSASAAPASSAASPAAASSASSFANVNCSQPLEFGVLVPYTGTLNADAQEFWHAANLAVNDLNAKGGVDCHKLKAVLGDTVDQRPDQVAAAANQLFNNPGVNIIMTAYASQTDSEFPLMVQHGMPYIVGGGATQTAAIISKDPSKYWMIWSTVPSYDAYNNVPAQQMNQWLKSMPGYNFPSNPSVYTIASDNPYSVRIAKALDTTFQGLGWKINGYDTVPFQAITDWGASLAKIRANPPTVIINTDYNPSNDATFIKQFRQNPTNSVVFMQYGPINAQFCQLAGSDGVGVIYDSIGGPISGGNSQSAKMAASLKQEYEAKYGKNSAGYFFGVGYYDVVLYSEAVKAVGDPTNRKAIAAWFSKLDQITPSGRLKFDPKTHLATFGAQYLPLQIWQIGPDCARPLIYPPNLTTDKFVLPPWMH